MTLPVNKQSGIPLALCFGPHHSELCPHVASQQILWLAEVGESGEGAGKGAMSPNFPSSRPSPQLLNRAPGLCFVMLICLLVFSQEMSLSYS